MQRLLSLIPCLTAALFSPHLSVSTPYSEYILAPSSRILYPISVHSVKGSVDDAIALTTVEGTTVFHDKSAVTLDFGKNIAGIVSIDIRHPSNEDQSIGVTFSESSLWISGEASDATAYAGFDEPLWFSVTRAGNYSASTEHQRGAFRYMSIVKTTKGSVEVNRISIYFTAVPHYLPDDGMRNYSGYFHCDDERLNRVWYAGMYTRV